MLSERVLLDDVGPTVGGLVSARGLCRMFAAVERCVNGDHVAGLPEQPTMHRLLSARRGSVHDLVLGKRCDFAGGFMVNLVEHGFGSAVGRGAIGHVGGSGHAVGFCDPEINLAAGFYLNGANVGLDEHSEAIRAMIVDNIVLDARR